jgi:predicted metal-dependent peptidase
VASLIGLLRTTIYLTEFNMQKLTAEQRIERCHVGLMKHPNFVAYSGLLMIGGVSVKDDCPTAYTNGRDVTYGRGFVDSLEDDAELRGVILHETKHKMYRHMTTWTHLWKRNAQVANMACDYVINLEIKDEEEKSNKYVMLPKCGLYAEKFRGMSSSEVFDQLMLNPPPPNPDGGGSGDGIDEHGWEEAQEMDDKEVKELAKEIDSAIRQGAILAGKVGGDVDRSFTDLMSSEVDWKEALREFVSAVCSGKDDTTWRKPNRRWLQHDIYMPSTISESMGRLCIAVDTSGSISGSDINKFLSEVVSVMNNVNPEMVDLLYWDSNVAGHEVYGVGEGDKLMASTKPKGGGGTSPSCITTYLKGKDIKPEACVVLTDGYVGSDWGGDWSCPVLWAIVGGCKDVPSKGSVIYIK